MLKFASPFMHIEKTSVWIRLLELNILFYDIDSWMAYPGGLQYGELCCREMFNGVYG